MAIDTRAVWDHLAIERDEVVALSVVYEKTADAPRLMAASLLAGPPAIADGWPRWKSKEGFKPAPNPEHLGVPGSFVAEIGGVIAGRAVLDGNESYRWLRSSFEKGVVPGAGSLPEARASLSAARAPIRVCTHSQTAAGDLATWLARPVVAFHFRDQEPAGSVAAPGEWTVAGINFFVMGAVDLLGLSWFDGKNGPPPAGLLVGRFERRAWLASQRLVPEHELYKVQLGLEPDRVQLADLEIAVEESVDDELVFGKRLRIEDTDITEAQRLLYESPPAGQRLEVGVGLPTLGRGVKRSVRLHHRDGTLLDEWESFNIVEAVSITLTVNGHEQKPIRTGESRESQDMVALLGAVARVESQYNAMQREGARNRLFDDLDMGKTALRELLERAQGEILVLDPYLSDWSLLGNLGEPLPRVLIGPSTEPPPEGTDVRAKQWQTTPVPFHDRFFLWEGGGVSVGTSASTKGQNRLFRIVRIAEPEAEILRQRFTQWWDDPGFKHV